MFLGGWEALSFTGRVPSVSAFVCRCRGRWRAADVLVVLWAAGLLRHLLTYKEGNR